MKRKVRRKIRNTKLKKRNEPTDYEGRKYEDYLEFIKKECDKKAEVITSIGKDESYILPNYECKLCNDTGYVMQNSHSIMCSCLKQKIFDLEYNKSNIYYV